MAITEKCDVYSFGVVALETLMGRHPVELLSTLLSPSSSASSFQHIMLNEILDIRLPPPNHRLERDVLLVAKMAFACLRPEPKSRPTMKWVSQGFLSQKKPTAKPLHAVSLWQLRNQEMHDIGENQIQSGNDACG